MNRQLHAQGITRNYGPKHARLPRELRRITTAIRRVLWRRPNTLALWVHRDRLHAKHTGHGFLSASRLTSPYAGFVVCVGTRALLILKGEPSDTPGGA